MGLPFTLSPIGVLETLGLFVDWAISMEGAGILRWYMRRPSELLSAPLRALIHEQGWAMRRSELLNRSLVEKIPKEHQQTLQDIMYGGGRTGTIGRIDVMENGKAWKALDDVRDAQMRRVVESESGRALLNERHEPGPRSGYAARPEEAHALREKLKQEGKLFAHYEERLPGLVWDSSANVSIPKSGGGSATKVGGWKVNPLLEGEISPKLINQFRSQAQFMNKWGRDLSLRAVEVSHGLKNHKFYNTKTESWQYGIFDNQAAINKFWWPQQYKSWSKFTHFLNRVMGKALGRDKAFPLWEETLRKMQGDLAVADVAGAPTMGAASSKIQVSELNRRGYSLEAKKMIGMEQNLMNQAVGGLGEAEFMLRQAKIYQAIARDPNLSFQGKQLRGSTFRKPGTPTGKLKILSGGIERRGKWIKMSSEVMYPGSKTPRWLELAGRWIHEDVFWHLKYTEEIAAVASKSKWAKAVTYFKQAHTVWNAPTLMRNLYANILLLAPMNDMIMMGKNMAYYKRALHEMATGGKLYVQAYKHGAFDGTFAQTELGRGASTAVLRGLIKRGKVSLAEIKALPNNLATGNIPGLSATGRLFLSETPGVFYNAMDTWPRFADWLKQTNMGKDFKMYRPAAKSVQWKWFNYSDITGAGQVMRGPTQAGFGLRNLTFVMGGKPFWAYLEHSMAESGPIRQWLKRKPLVAQMYINLHETLSVKEFASAMADDIDAARAWMKTIKSQSQPWRRYRYIPMSSTGVIGKAIEAISGTPNIRTEIVKETLMVEVPTDQYGALPEGTHIVVAYRGKGDDEPPGKGGDVVEVKTMDDAIRIATESLGKWGTTSERRLAVSRIIREGTSKDVYWDEQINMWVVAKEITQEMAVPMLTRWFNIGYYTPIDWLIPQLESYNTEGWLYNFAAQVMTNQNPLTTIAYAATSGKDPYTGKDLYKPRAGASEWDKFFGPIWSRTKFGVQTMLPPWLFGKSYEKLLQIGDKDYRGRVRDSMETWFDVLGGVKYETDVHVPDGVARQLKRFGEDVRATEKRVADDVVEEFKGTGMPTVFSYPELKKIATQEVSHPDISVKDANAALDYYMKTKAVEGLRMLRMLKRSIATIPTLPARYRNIRKDDDMPRSAKRIEDKGALRGEDVDVLAIKAIIAGLPITAWENMLITDSDISEEEWVSFLQREFSSEGQLSRQELLDLGKQYKNKSKGYKMIFRMLFGEEDPAERLSGEKGFITVLHSLGTVFEKFVDRDTEKRLYKAREKKKNGND
jgi:hypothetical protein